MGQSQAGGLRYYLNSHATRVALIHSSFWEQTNAGDSTHSVVQVLQAGRLGTLELKAPACEIGAVPHPGTQPGERSFGPWVSDERVFEIVSELLAEGWVKGVSKSSSAVAGPLRFDTKLAKRKAR